VASPASSPTPNAIGIGVSSSLTTWTITDTAATIQQGTTQYVLLAGQGLNANMTVTISGPGDITVSNVQAISSSGTPIIAFSANVSNSAALGARTVILQDTNNDITTFAGSLEVIP
jgi:D-arabinose 1-dehydrogenase-like Zn-dependent alcohol dehydrogenase